LKAPVQHEIPTKGEKGGKNIPWRPLDCLEIPEVVDRSDVVRQGEQGYMDNVHDPVNWLRYLRWRGVVMFT
jgi:hypothetical protein